jgi:hypothetical protein
MLNHMPIVSGGTSGAANRGPGAMATIDPSVYASAARVAAETALREWIRYAKLRGDHTGSMVSFQCGCLTSTWPIAAPVRDAMINAGAPALLAVAVSECIESNWRVWASQLSATLIGFPQFEFSATSTAPPTLSSLLPVPLRTLSSPGNSVLDAPAFPSLLRNTSAPFLSGSSGTTLGATQVTGQTRSGLAMTTRPVAAAAAGTNTSTSRPAFAAVISTGAPSDHFLGLGSWLSACFNDWFLGAYINQLWAFPKGAIPIPVVYGLPPASRIVGVCEASLGGLRRFGERA